MYIVHVKHYLNQKGLKYFSESWFPEVKDVITQQTGYISIIHDVARDYEDCVNVIVTFDNQLNLEKWAEHKDHDYLVDSLDQYRCRDYWEYSCTEDAKFEYNKLEWQRVGS